MNEPRPAIGKIIQPREIDLGGVSIRRCLPAADIAGVGPWVFFDHIGPAAFSPGTGVDVIPHPHIGLATVTYLFEGQLVHRDSIGSVQRILPGEVNLMVAGRGIVHSERTGPELGGAGQRLHGLQLWFALPVNDEEQQPAFFHYEAAALPETRSHEVNIRLLIGEAWGLRSPVPTWSPTLYAEAGRRLTARQDSRMALIGGAPLGRRSMWWNFVSSRPGRIQQAKADWRCGRFPAVPGETERAALPERDASCEEHCA